MKKAIFKITSFLLAILVLFSTVSLTVEKHFCGNFLVDTALFSVADSCGMSVELEQSVKKQYADGMDCSVTKTPCCSDETALIEGQDTLQTVVSLELQPQLLFVQSFVYTYLNLFENLEEQVVSFWEYTPPPVVRDIQVLYDTFLI